MKSAPSLAFYAIIDTTYVDAGDFPRVTEAILRGQPELIQIRAKKESTAERKALVASVLPLFDRKNEPSLPLERLIINDDAEVCREFPRIGLHVGQDDLPIAEARDLLGPDRLLGLSTHSLAQAKAANEADVLSYFAVGPVFATPTKPEAGAVGLELVAAVAALPPRRPVYAIGGIKVDNFRQVIRPGITGVVAVSEILQATNPAAVIKRYRAECDR